MGREARSDMSETRSAVIISPIRRVSSSTKTSVGRLHAGYDRNVRRVTTRIVA